LLRFQFQSQFGIIEEIQALFSDLQAVEEVGGRRLREVQLSLLALLEESVQVGVLAQTEEFIKISSQQLYYYLVNLLIFWLDFFRQLMVKFEHITTQAVI